MQSELNELLTKAKDLLKDETTKISYETWIKNLEIQSANNGNIILLASSTFQKDAIESRYHDLLTNTFKFITNKDCTVTIVAKDEVQETASNTNTNVSLDVNCGYSNSTLNPKYTFDTFVVGNNNRFAHAAALAVAEAPATSYNPLFIYGGVGLGKTHLMHSIGNEILKKNRESKILYVTSEKFTNQLINAIKDNKNEQFRTRYRNIDVLLIDDIQFIAGKERIQEEFFHTFNTLHESGKQIIISSDRPPKDIQLLEDRLKSRFEWGLIADISNPDYETRLAILRKKAQLDNIIIDDEILSNIATRIDSNIRELEGTLNKLIAKSEYVIVNEDIGTIIDLLKDIKSNIITYGFNSKSTITMSSVTDDSIQVSVQRNIISKKSEVEQQEISLNKEAKSDVYDIMLLISLLLIHNNEDINNVKF